MYRDKGINATGLKIIAALTMLTDHIGILLLGHGIPVQLYYALRMIGRLSFPIFAFLIVQGFLNTHSFWKYFFRILIFAIVSEVPYNLFISGKILYFDKNCILFTFALGLLVLYAISKFVNIGIKGMFATFAIVTVAMAVAYALHLDYSWCAILLLTFIYMSGADKTMMYVSAAIILLLNGHDFIQLTAPLALVIIHFYNGKKGKGPKYGFYLFYPLHLLILGIISILLF